MIKTDQINHLLGIKESYQASDALTKILFDKDRRENLFKAFLDKDCNLDKDWLLDVANAYRETAVLTGKLIAKTAELERDKNV